MSSSVCVGKAKGKASTQNDEDGARPTANRDESRVVWIRGVMDVKDDNSRQTKHGLSLSLSLCLDPSG